MQQMCQLCMHLSSFVNKTNVLLYLCTRQKDEAKFIIFIRDGGGECINASMICPVQVQIKHLF